MFKLVNKANVRTSQYIVQRRERLESLRWQTSKAAETNPAQSDASYNDATDELNNQIDEGDHIDDECQWGRQISKRPRQIGKNKNANFELQLGGCSKNDQGQWCESDVVDSIR